MFRISILSTTFLICFSSAAQNLNGSPDLIESAFETYKQCIKVEKHNGKNQITKTNYQALCQKELARLKSVSQGSYPVIQNIIEKWIGSMEQKS
ncbi:hypothetical protein [Aliiglaciecola lipolytica]|uniref:hypothetical protein n=1 Tax=Aliiglaciecola lipolytica TaxID=477689 RepID=UPI001C09C520|nr:hypothetical protein [Aliiglaciecola lipolytica]MBU2877077.1 hypothetical protein [Aliiglaciecola lipolytica]